MNKQENAPEGASCSTSGFNYCYWSKFIIAVPVVFITSFLASSLVSGPLTQVWVGALAGIGIVYLAIRIDKIPALQGMIVKKKD